VQLLSNNNELNYTNNYWQTVCSISPWHFVWFSCQSNNTFEHSCYCSVG